MSFVQGQEALLPSHTTHASCSSRFRLCLPEIRKKLTPVLQAKHTQFLCNVSFQKISILSTIARSVVRKFQGGRGSQNPNFSRKAHKYKNCNFQGNGAGVGAEARTKEGVNPKTPLFICNKCPDFSWKLVLSIESVQYVTPPLLLSHIESEDTFSLVNFLFLFF